MTEFYGEMSGTVQPFPDFRQPPIVSDELHRIRDLLRNELPGAPDVYLEFDGRLKAHIDIRDRQEIPLVEDRLAKMCGGKLFSQISRGGTPHHPFFHRVTASIER